MYAFATKNWGVPICVTHARGVPRCVTMCDKGREPKLAQNSVTNFMDALPAFKKQLKLYLIDNPEH